MVDGEGEDHSICPRASDRAPLERTLTAIRPATEMNCKTDKIRAVWAAGDRIGALRIAARFFDRSDDTKLFKRGMAAHNHPEFYRQIGKNAEQIVGNALEVLAMRFGLH
jgi:hypothetical protein